MLREFIPCVDHSLRLYFSGFKFLVDILYQKLLKLVDFHSVTQKIKMDAIRGHFKIKLYYTVLNAGCSE